MVVFHWWVTRVSLQKSDFEIVFLGPPLINSVFFFVGGRPPSPLHENKVVAGGNFFEFFWFIDFYLGSRGGHPPTKKTAINKGGGWDFNYTKRVR